MTDGFEQSTSENTYIIDSEQGAEMARLLDLDRLATRNMGGLFPDGFDPLAVQRILDVACGPGGWTQEVAFAHPELDVVGFDISQSMIAYATMQAQVQGLENIAFHVMDATRPLAFPDEAFDFVNARFLVGFMPKDGWPRLVNECFRILRSGGTLRLTDSDEAGRTNSPAFEHLHRLGTLTWAKVGRSFNPEGSNIGLTPMLGAFLQQAGFVNLQMQAYVLDFSAGTEAHLKNCQMLIAAYKLMQPFMVKVGAASDEEWSKYHEQMQVEMLDPSFRGLWYFMSVRGQKP